MKIQLENGLIKVSINSRGAEMQSLYHKIYRVEYLWQGDTGRAIHMFPYIARLTEGSYFLDGDRYRMKPHGFIQDTELHYERTGETSIMFWTEESEDTVRQYPRNFRYEVEYGLSGNTLLVTYRILNRDNKPMYFGVGAHPGFRVPLEEGLRFEDYELEFEDAETLFCVGMSAACYVTGCDYPYPMKDGKKIKLRHELFKDDAIILYNTGNKVELKTRKGMRGLTVKFPDLKYLGIWHTPETDAPFVCIEPWSSLPSRQGIVERLEEQENLIQLEPGQWYENHWSVSLW